MSDAICDKCGDDNLTDLPVCPSCAAVVHFEHRVCVCAECRERSLRLTQNAASTVRWSNEAYTETAKRAGGVLVIRKAA